MRNRREVRGRKMTRGIERTGGETCRLVEGAVDFEDREVRPPPCSNQSLPNPLSNLPRKLKTDKSETSCD